MKKDIRAYHDKQTDSDKKICDLLYKEINKTLTEAENKLWHAHPVWFLDGNPIVGYSKLKDCIRLMFWSGMGFEEDQLSPEPENSKMLQSDILMLTRSILKIWNDGSINPGKFNGITKTS